MQLLITDTSELTPFFAHRILIDDIVFSSIFQYYAYSKFKKTNNSWAKLILNTTNKYQLITMCNSPHYFPLPSWETDKYKIMVNGYFHLFTQFSRILDNFLNTDDAEFIFSELPQYWGGIYNNLGRLLEDSRAYFNKLPRKVLVRSQSTRKMNHIRRSSRSKRPQSVDLSADIIRIIPRNFSPSRNSLSRSPSPIYRNPYRNPIRDGRFSESINEYKISRSSISESIYEYKGSRSSISESRVFSRALPQVVNPPHQCSLTISESFGDLIDSPLGIPSPQSSVVPQGNPLPQEILEMKLQNPPEPIPRNIDNTQIELTLYGVPLKKLICCTYYCISRTALMCLSLGMFALAGLIFLFELV